METKLQDYVNPTFTHNATPEAHPGNSGKI